MKTLAKINFAVSEGISSSYDIGLKFNLLYLDAISKEWQDRYNLDRNCIPVERWNHCQFESNSWRESEQCGEFSTKSTRKGPPIHGHFPTPQGPKRCVVRKFFETMTVKGAEVRNPSCKENDELYHDASWMKGYMTQR